MIPFTTFRGHIRSIDRDLLNAKAREELDLACPGFLDQDPSPEDLDRRRRDQLYDYIYVESRARRRFGLSPMVESWGGQFGRGRYHSVATTPDGHDNLALALELIVYMVPQMTGWHFIFDLLDDGDRHLILDRLDYGDRELLDQIPTNAIAILSRPHLNVVSATVLPAKCQTVEIQRCVDLRYPMTRQWFFETFRTGDGTVFHKPCGTDAENFYDMLPSLLWPEPGGGEPGEVTRTIALWMMLRNVEALIYPSARCDVEVKIHNGEILSWKGWCLVDYRGVRDVREINQLTVDMGRWKVGAPYPVTLWVGAEGSPDAGSFSLGGVVDGQMTPLMDELEALLAQLRADGPD
jgi:hypothetical protein